jgi:rhodanese-related sulfurtransferase
MMKSITANELSNMVASGKHIDLIDVRTPMEYRSLHVTIARNEPLSGLDPKAIQSARNGSSGEPLYVVCRSGGRSKQACEKFLASGITNVINVEGGTMACESAGMPVVRGKKSIPLNCQVQIITGSLVVLGSALAVWGHPYWAALPGLMGAGLMFSGITDTCAMGSCLARMPWNQSSGSTTVASGSETTCCNK